MFEIKVKEGIDENLFNESYAEIKDILNCFIMFVDDRNKLELLLEQLGYKEVSYLINFLKLCESNYVVDILFNEMTEYIHKQEDEKFLQFYAAFQEGNGFEWLSKLSSSDLLMVKNSFINDEYLSLAFPDMFSMINESEKTHNTYIK